MIPIIMPQVGQDIPTGKIVEWLKKEGEPVAKGETILVVQSEKASFEVEAEVEGILLKILHTEDEEIDILTVVGFIGRPEERFDAAQAVGGPARTGARPVSVEIPSPSVGQARSSVAAEGVSHPTASPSARRIARERGLDLAAVAGSGPGGRVIKRDVVDSTAGLHLEVAPGDTVVPFTRLRKKIAERLTESVRTIPHFHLLADVDLTAALVWRKRVNADCGLHLTVTDLVIKAVALALRHCPTLNAHVGRDRIVLRKSINIGIAVSVADGLLVPVVPDANHKPLAEISAMAKKNADNARRGMVDPRVMGTFTVSSLGMYGVRHFLPVINPPECAILGMGAALPQVVPMPSGFEERQVMALTLACDHRAVDGVAGAALLNDIKAALENIETAGKAWL